MVNPDFDPFQIFEVQHEHSLILNVTVVRGRNITKGFFWDLFDWPDPYIILKIKECTDGKKWTKCITNNKNPIWNEKFTFYLYPKEGQTLNISLMEGNYGPVPDTLLGSVEENISHLPFDEIVKKKYKIKSTGRGDIFIEFHKILDTTPDLRYSLCLSEEEKQFRDKRLKRVFECLQKVLPENQTPNHFEEVPIIAVIGSGGGFRAMTAFSGAIKALEDSGILDCVTYTSALSGSSWYLSTLYSHPKWPLNSSLIVQQKVRESISHSLLRHMNMKSIRRYIDLVLQKRHQGQPVSFTDFFGLMIGETLLGERMNAKLSDQQSILRHAKAPMPLYACVHVKKDVSARKFQEWVEFTPYEIGMPKYGCFLKTTDFGNKFFMGRICRKYPEPPLHYLQGCWGSAFCILFKQLLNKEQTSWHSDPVETERTLTRINSEKHRELNKSAKSVSPQSVLDSIYEDVNEYKRVSCSDEFCTNAKNVKESNSFYDDDNDTDSIYREHDSSDSSASEAEELELENTKNKEKTIFSKLKIKTASSNFWETCFKKILDGNNILNDRTGRAAVVHNFMRGLNLTNSHSTYAPFIPSHHHEFGTSITIDEKDEFDGLYEIGPQTTQKHMYMVDAGLSFNSPFPLVLRQQRGVDLILSFDFSARQSDRYPPIKELLLAYKWALMHHVPFPHIDKKYTQESFYKDSLCEVYIFKEDNPRVPIVMHFVLANETFKQYKHPGVKRETEEEFEFANFSIFNDEKSPYSTFNFVYDPLDFDRLATLTEFNTLLHLDKIKACIAECVEKRRNHLLTSPFDREAIKRLSHLNNKSYKSHEFNIDPNQVIMRQNSLQKLRNYLARQESLHHSFSQRSVLYENYDVFDGNAFTESLQEAEIDSDGLEDMPDDPI